MHTMTSSTSIHCSVVRANIRDWTSGEGGRRNHALSRAWRCGLRQERRAQLSRPAFLAQPDCASCNIQTPPTTQPTLSTPQPPRTHLRGRPPGNYPANDKSTTPPGETKKRIFYVRPNRKPQVFRYVAPPSSRAVNTSESNCRICRSSR